jgi:hypothetical protein
MEEKKTGDAFGGQPNSVEIKAAEDKAVKSFIALERAELKFGLEFGLAMIDLRNKKKTAGERDWMAYLKRLGIEYEAANKWMNKAAGKETRHGKAKAKAGSSKTETSGDSTETPFASWDRLARELNALSGYAVILKNSQPVGEPFIAELTKLAETMGFKLEPKGGSK